MADKDQPPTPEEISARLRASGQRRQDYTIKLANGTEIAADGAEDHTRAMAMVEKIGAIGGMGYAPPPPQNAPIKRIALAAAVKKWEGAIKNPDPKTIGAKRRALADLIEWKQGLLDADASEIGGPGTVANPVLVDEFDNHTFGEWFIYLNSRRKFDPDKGEEVPYYSPGTMENKFIYAGVFFRLGHGKQPLSQGRQSGERTRQCRQKGQSRTGSLARGATL